MDLGKGRNQPYLQIKAATWYKDSHSLFDYESTKINVVPFQMQFGQKNVTVYRKRQSNFFLIQPGMWWFSMTARAINLTQKNISY